MGAAVGSAASCKHFGIAVESRGIVTPLWLRSEAEHGELARQHLSHGYESCLLTVRALDLSFRC